MADDTKNGQSAEDLAKENAELKETNDALLKQIASNEKKSKADLPTVSAKGKKYQFTLPKFKLGGETFTAEQACENTEVIAELIKINSALLVPVGS